MEHKRLVDFCAFLNDENTKDVCFACHVSPDGDTVGSAIALARLVRARGRRAFVFVPDTLPDTLTFLFDGFDNTAFDPQTVVAVDVSTPERLGPSFEWHDRVAGVIDHHEKNGFDVPHMLVAPEMSATALLVSAVYDELGQAMDKDVSKALYTALSTDTGRFCHSNTTPDVFFLAARLAKQVEGENFGELNRKLFVEKSPEHLRLEAYVVSHARTNEKEGYVFFALTRALRRKFSLSRADADLGALVDVLRAFRGFDVFVLAKEGEERGTYKLSVRSEGDIAANELCALFGGGGHRKAAGCTVRSKSVRALEKRFSKTLKEFR